MSEFNSEPIDIIVPWVNPNDNVWFKEYSHWKTIYKGPGTHIERIRDFGNFKYWFRAVEKNMPWVRYVFLVVPYKTSIPAWLNINHPKLKIVFQDDYIPKKFLPTFNSYICTLYFHNIPELSNNFIYSNDDMIFSKPQKENDWFINDKPVRAYGYHTGHHNGGPKDFDWNVKNACEFISKIVGQPLVFHIWHSSFAFQKNFIAFLFYKYGNIIEKSLEHSKFRQRFNLTDLIIDFGQQALKVAVNKPSISKNCLYFGLRSNSKKTDMINAMKTYSCVCFNDNEFVTGDTKELQKNLISALNEFLPNKSSYEI